MAGPLRELGRLIGRMHAAGIGHRDLKPANLLVVKGDLTVTTYLVDLEGVRPLGHLSVSHRAKDLARLAAGISAHPWIPATIRLRFLQAYLAESPADSIEWKALWRAIDARADGIVRRKLARGGEVL